MLILFSLGFLLLTLSICTGYYISKFLRAEADYQFRLFEVFLCGVAGLTVYLNIASIFLPTNYFLLLPAVVLSFYLFRQKEFRQQLSSTIAANRRLLFGKQNSVITCSILLVVILFTLVPPYNTDSSGYHFLSIRWNERFKAVPGLANLFPQYGYNSSFFVLSAAFSFTNVFGQSVYPINFILTTLFFLWLLKKSFSYSHPKKLFIWLLLIVLLRQFPINLASPSADALTSILVFYVLFSLYEKVNYKWHQSEWKWLILLSVFAVVIKLSTLPLLLIALVPLIMFRDSYKSIAVLYAKLFPLALLIIIPWLVRNIILSGYLVFPLPSVDVFSFDWKVPTNIVIAERQHIAHAPRMISHNYNYVEGLNFLQWFPRWLPNLWRDNHFNFILVLVGLFSPVIALYVHRKNKSIKSFQFLTWLIAYVGVWFWLITSPDIRFGYHYLLPCILLPLLSYAKNFSYQPYTQLLPYAICLICFYYDFTAIKKLQPYSFSQYVVRPLRSPEYYKRNDLNTFQYVMLNNGVKLYIQDSTHHSINAPLPSCYPYNPALRMRGNKLQDGFKTLP
jgi:hypothetical protein